MIWHKLVNLENSTYVVDFDPKSNGGYYTFKFHNISSLLALVVNSEFYNCHFRSNWGRFTLGHTFDSYCMAILKIENFKILALLTCVVIFGNFGGHFRFS